MTTIYFSHRPKAGISVGISHDGQNLIVAMAFTSNGLSSNGLLDKNRKDRFSRPMARQILTGRILTGHKKFVKTYQVPENFRFGRFMNNFRGLFKPDYKEPDFYEFTRDNNSVDRNIELIDELVKRSL